MYIYNNVSPNSSWSENRFRQNDAEKIKTHILCPMIFFAENRAVYDVTRENIVQPDRPQMTMQYGACSLQEVKNIHKYSNHLTLRLLMSYIYMEHLFLMFLDHIRRRSTVGMTPLDE